MPLVVWGSNGLSGFWLQPLSFWSAVGICCLACSSGAPVHRKGLRHRAGQWNAYLFHWNVIGFRSMWKKNNKSLTNLLSRFFSASLWLNRSRLLCHQPEREGARANSSLFIISSRPSVKNPFGFNPVLFITFSSNSLFFSISVALFPLSWKTSTSVHLFHFSNNCLIYKRFVLLHECVAALSLFKFSEKATQWKWLRTGPENHLKR